MQTGQLKSFVDLYKSYVSKMARDFRESAGGPFARNVFTTVSGTTIAQLIPVLFSPLLTRLFDPAEFGLFANFVAISGILTVFWGGKYELAIVLPRTHEEAVTIVGLCSSITVVLTVFFSLILLFFGDLFASLIPRSGLSHWMWLIPLSTFLSSMYLYFNEWCIRKSNYLVLSKNRITNTAGITGASVILGLMKLNLGLILGQIAGQAFSLFLAFRRVFEDDRHLIKYVSYESMKSAAKRYVRFAKFNILGSFTNSIAVYLPIFFLSSQFGMYQAGLYALTDRVLGVPMNFIGNSFRDVFKQRASVEYREKGNCVAIYKKAVFALAAIAILPFLGLLLLTPVLFSFAFGDKWIEAGVYARLLSLMYFFSFVSMPTGWLFVIAERQELDLTWQMIFLLFTAVALIIGAWIHDAHITLILLCGGRCITFIIQLIMTYNLAKGHFYSPVYES